MPKTNMVFATETIIVIGRFDRWVIRCDSLTGELDGFVAAGFSVCAKFSNSARDIEVNFNRNRSCPR